VNHASPSASSPARTPWSLGGGGADGRLWTPPEGGGGGGGGGQERVEHYSSGGGDEAPLTPVVLVVLWTSMACGYIVGCVCFLLLRCVFGLRGRQPSDGVVCASWRAHNNNA
jgi:hypothetical protein